MSLRNAEEWWDLKVKMFHFFDLSYEDNPRDVE